jgi:hypothetical protein
MKKGRTMKESMKESMKEPMKDDTQKNNKGKKKQNRRTMLERAKLLAQPVATDWDFIASKGPPPRSDDREPYAGIKEESR